MSDIPFADKHKKPVREGQRVLVNNPWADRVHTGTVDAVLSEQFTFIDDDDGQTYFCNYNGDWKDNEPR